LTPNRAADAAFGTHRVSPVDVLDPGATAEIAVEVPGVRKEGFEVYMFGERLNLKGKKSSERADADNGIHRVERRCSAWMLRVCLLTGQWCEKPASAKNDLAL